MSVSVRKINFTIVSLVTILVLSSFTHLWNAAGFPDIFFDEGVYMRRAMHVLNGLGPQEAFFHDHPFFGQIFLAGTLAITGYPNSLHPTTDAQSIATLYLAPRIIMGILSVADTFLIYIIASKRYEKNVGLVASLLFAVMPITWLTRRILLDSILLPFLLLSILFVLYSRGSDRKTLLVLLSGVCLGLAIFTKIPVFTMILLVGYILYSDNKKNPKILGLWFIPVILIPLIWPIQSILAGQFDGWLKDVLWQTQRGTNGLSYITYSFLKYDPVLFSLGIAGFVYAAVRKDSFMLMWLVPFLVFLFSIGYNQYFYWIPILPVFCISSAVLIINLLAKVEKTRIRKILNVAIISGVGIFGLVNTVMLITTDMSSAQFQVAEFVAKDVTNKDDVTILASPVYSWIFNSIFHDKNVLLDYSIILFGPPPTSKILLVADQHFFIDMGRGKELRDAYNSTSTIATFEGKVGQYDISKYPYKNLEVNYEGNKIDVRVSK